MVHTIQPASTTLSLSGTIWYHTIPYNTYYLWGVPAEGTNPTFCFTKTGMVFNNKIFIF